VVALFLVVTVQAKLVLEGEHHAVVGRGLEQVQDAVLVDAFISQVSISISRDT